MSGAKNGTGPASCFALVRFDHKNDNRPKPDTATWPQLAARLTRHEARAQKDGPAWSPAEYLPGATRGAANVRAVTCFVGDVDDGTAPDALRERWQGLVWCLYSTHGSTPDKPKWRVAFPLARPVPAGDWAAVHRKLTLALLGEHADPACKDCSRLYYLPSCPPDALPHAFADVQEGAPLDPDAYPDPDPMDAAGSQMRHALREQPRLVGEERSSNSSDNRPGDDYNERGPVLELLQSAGWQVEAQRGDEVALRRPGKTAGTSATFGFADACGGRMFFCFTSSAPPFEANTGYWPFAVYATLRHGGDFGEAARQLGREGYGDQTGHASMTSAVTVKRAVREASQVAAQEEDAPGHASMTDAPQTFRKSDSGNAERFVREHGAGLRYDHSRKAWFVWDGRRWAEDRDGQAQERAKATVRGLYAEAGKAETDEERAALAMHAKNSDKHARIMALIALANSDPRVAVTSAAWDTDPWALNVENGTLDLRTGELRPHRAADLLTRLAPVAYDPDASAPTWEAALRRWHPDPDVRAFLQRAAGYSLTGNIGEETAFFTYGLGRNGKSKFVGALETVLGDYAARVNFNVLMDAQKAGNATPDLVKLIGARLVIASEVQEGRRLNESFIKDATGGDKLTARALYAGVVEFTPQFKLWLYGNHKPRIVGTDDGIWARLPLIPFTVTIPEGERDPDLAAKLAAERAGILAWAVQGCLEWRRSRLKPPAAVIAATNEYRAEMDPVAGFVGDRCQLHPDAWTASAELFADYAAWADANGERHALTGPELSKHLTTRYGCEAKSQRHAGKVQRGLSGVGLLSCRGVDGVDGVDGRLSETAHENSMAEVTQNGVTPSTPSTKAQNGLLSDRAVDVEEGSDADAAAFVEVEV